MNQPPKNGSHKETTILILSVFIAGLCSIIYELLIGSASAYFLGDTVKQFSITIGLYMAAMGLGSFISRLIKTNLLSKFIAVEIILGFIGGTSIPILYFCYAYTNAYSTFMILLIVIIGILIGLEIPLITRIMERYYTLEINISNVLSVDYLGALIATLLFPFLLLPFLGTFKSSLFFGLVNMSIGYMNLWCFREKLHASQRRFYILASTGITIFLVVLIGSSEVLLKKWSSNLYQDRIIFSRQTKYQQVVLTKNKDDIRMFIDGNLQFSSIDEYRYHEALVHIPLSVVSYRKNILLLGGGDGLAVREILKYPEVERITLVDIDREIVRISNENHFLKLINRGSLQNRRVKIVHQDALKFLENTSGLYDVIISDLPDPNNISLARLYSKEFYKLINSRLAPSGVFLTQATSPFFSKKAFWCIHNTAANIFKYVYPYHVYVPSFGDWGFVMASKIRFIPNEIALFVPTKYLDNKVVESSFLFPRDLKNPSPQVSTLDRPLVLGYYLEGWRYWN
ncbi:polyamine aminopropyltransferase [Thermodesulfobacteriota bacterium]